MPHRAVLYRGSSFVSFSSVSSSDESTAHGDESLGKADEPLTTGILQAWTSQFSKNQTRKFHNDYVGAYVQLQQAYANLEQLKEESLAVERALSQNHKESAPSTASSVGSTRRLSKHLKSHKSNGQSPNKTLEFRSLPYDSMTESAPPSPLRNGSSSSTLSRLLDTNRDDTDSLVSSQKILRRKVEDAEQSVSKAHSAMKDLLLRQLDDATMFHSPSETESEYPPLPDLH
ncbi:hypothetical protein SJAG_04935 [Schizosaccharomyces japonicus yFS275]|uniref:Uncharacterized protein n=1 Tax=Schizosaccharomyces japonicus (strain yFS275 / FY16936) TaxID=402676 RepID=B6K859_SCHJY|nr:hypothetical protein SJAG_04935 [Schizosaccharomyces japonicus yFS275]EEB09713.1 hypothetical protein SJAG_04935 [Schizosaccharomyces japonicus yFS275]